ncbi:MAG: hypothetical protein RSE91_03225 [Bacilli bacterium]
MNIIVGHVVSGKTTITNLLYRLGKINNQIVACEKVGLYDSFSNFPNGYNTKISKDIHLLSIVQKQLLEIVRVIVLRDGKTDVKEKNNIVYKKSPLYRELKNNIFISTIPLN